MISLPLVDLSVFSELFLSSVSYPQSSYTNLVFLRTRDSRMHISWSYCIHFAPMWIHTQRFITWRSVLSYGWNDLWMKIQFRTGLLVAPTGGGMLRVSWCVHEWLKDRKSEGCLYLHFTHISQWMKIYILTIQVYCIMSQAHDSSYTFSISRLMCLRMVSWRQSML